MMENNAAYNSLLARRSVRAYTKEVPDRRQIDLLVQAGQYAPTGMGRQQTAFLAVTSPELVATLSRLNADVLRAGNPAYNGDPFYGAPAVIAVLARSGNNAVKDGSAAIENILLAAYDLGLGSCWINRAKEVFESAEGRRILNDLNIPEDYEGIGFVIVGCPDPDVPVKAAPERTSLVRVVE